MAGYSDSFLHSFYVRIEIHLQWNCEMREGVKFEQLKFTGLFIYLLQADNNI